VSGGTKFVERFLSSWQEYKVGQTPYWHEEGALLIPGLPYNVAGNGEFVTAILPNVTYYYYPRGRPDETTSRSVATWIALRIRHEERYSWTSGSIPAVGRSWATWFYSSTPGTTQVASGVDLPVQDKNNRLILVAGVLLGVMGSALVGAFQEWRRSDPGGGPPPP
jgi:hypothetical protein